MPAGQPQARSYDKNQTSVVLPNVLVPCVLVKNLKADDHYINTEH